MYTIETDHGEFELPVTQEEWTMFLLERPAKYLDNFVEHLDSGNINAIERGHLIRKFNDWILMVIDHFDFDCYEEDSIVVSCDVLDLTYHIYDNDSADAKLYRTVFDTRTTFHD